MSCWTLWQKMPPRYQFTMRDIRADDQDPSQGADSRASSDTLNTPRLRTPRGRQRVDSTQERQPADGAMLTSGVLPENSPSEVEFGLQNPILPPRNSPYIHNMKNQMKINSAKRKIDEGTFVLTSPTTLSCTSKPRATTAPAFPITNPSNMDEYHRLTRQPQGHQNDTAVPNHQSLQRPQGALNGSKSPTSGGSAAESRRINVSVISPFGEMPELRAKAQNPVFQHHSSPTQQDCIIGGDHVAALHIDKSRVTLFRKTKPDVTHSVYSATNAKVTRDDGSYLPHMRKAYLSGVRDLPKMTQRKPDLEKRTTIRERMEYDRKVGRILDYYTKVEFPKDVQSPRIQDIQNSLSSIPQQAFRTTSSRKRAPGAVSEPTGTHPSSFNKGTEFPVSSAAGDFTKPHAQGQLQLLAREGGEFFRINSQARLHNRRHFYLRTPTGQSNPQDTELQLASGCVCGMCRLEMEMALMAQLHRDLGVSVNAANIRPSLEESALNTDSSHTAEAGLGAAGEGDTCAARPNSVSDSWRSATLSEPPVSINQESTTLTVTLPVIEEASEVTHALQENETVESSMNDSAEAADKCEHRVLVENSVPEPSNIVTTKDSTSLEESVSYDEGPGVKGIEDADNEPQSNIERDHPKTPDSTGSAPEIPQHHSEPVGDIQEKFSASSDSANTLSLQEDSAFCNSGEETVIKSTPNTLTERKESENVEVEKQIYTDDLPSDSEIKAIPDEKPGTSVQQTENHVTISTMKTRPTEETVINTNDGQDEISLGTHPPQIAPV